MARIGCDAARDQAKKEISSAVAFSTDAVLAQNQPRKSRCTSVLDAIERAADTPSMVIATLITDGRESCNVRLLGTPQHQIQIVVLLVASEGDAGERSSKGTLFEKRRLALMQSAPWLTVLPWFAYSEHTVSSAITAPLTPK